MRGSGFANCVSLFLGVALKCTACHCDRIPGVRLKMIRVSYVIDEVTVIGCITYF